MKKYLWSLFFISSFSFAALPPQYQNMKDLTAMVDYAKQHTQIISTLKIIDLSNQYILFGKNCQITFERAPRESGLLGPATDLVAQPSDCLIDSNESTIDN